MPWGRVDDNHYDHPKVMAIPRQIRNAADGLYWRAVSRCNRILSDGLLNDGDLALIDAEDDLVEALLAAGLFDRDRRGRIHVHDFLDHNKSRSEVIEEREKKAAAGRAGGLASGRARAKKARDEKRAEREANRSRRVEPPSRPVPSKDSHGSTSATRSGRRAPVTGAVDAQGNG